MLRLCDRVLMKYKENISYVGSMMTKVSNAGTLLIVHVSNVACLINI